MPADVRRLGAALVTGGGRRIGAEIARALARLGQPVAVHHLRSAAEAEEVAENIRRSGGAARAVAGDLASPDGPAALVDRAAAALGPLTTLVNNASIFEHDGIGALDADLWNRQMAVNLRAPVFLIEAFAAQLPPGAQGCVVNIIDQRALRPTADFLSYTLAKCALLTATETLAKALAPRIRVVAVGPGPTLPNGWQDAEAFARQQTSTPLARGPSPFEIAEAVVYLLGAENVTGVMIPVDGGQHLVGPADDGGPALAESVRGA
ncbi:SDR family oxidoreductase [Methylopila turkensis]|uniref:SDR family oxidoreductase n=1 Tax=Methylopila turkensis TaxID=1437816 RepID=UPI0022F2D465|nr:SDR family oxidoreductase [Methylopila turkensis]